MSVPQSKLLSVQKEYVEQLDEFLNINMSDVQVKNWAVALSKYDDDVLREGWNQFLYKVRPGLMPSIEDCTKIMQDLQMQHSRERHQATKKPLPERPSSEAKNFQKWMGAITYGLKMVSGTVWTEIDRKEYMIKTAKECSLPKRDIHEMEIDGESNSRPIFTFVLDFVINRGLAPQLQKALDDEEMNFNIGDYIDDKRS